MNGHKYTDEEKHFFVEFVSGHSYKEIQQEFITRFGWEITLSQVKGSITRYNLNTGRTGYFPKGNVPQNKGKKMPPEVYEKCKGTMFKKGNVPQNKGKKMPPEVYEKCKGTMFKKGNVPQNHRPVGSERITRDGYVEVKIAEPNKWTLKHRLIWQQAHGEIPKGHIVIFRDNNKQNIALENLMLISRKENAVMNHIGLHETIDETKDLAVSFAKLVSATHQRKKKRKK